MTDFLDPLVWTAGQTATSADNFNQMEQESTETRVLADYTAIAASQPTDLTALFAKLRRYTYTFAVTLPKNQDVVIKFPEPKDNTNYGVDITLTPPGRDDSDLGWGGTVRSNYSLDVVARSLTSVTVRFQMNGGSSSTPALVTVIGGIDF